MMLAIRQIEHEIAAGTAPAQIAETLSAEQLGIRRKFCDWLALWRKCERPACRRGRACGGDPARCFMQFYADCPEPVRVWVRAGSFFVEEGSTAREATYLADSVLATHFKHVTGLPQLTPRKRRNERRRMGKGAQRRAHVSQ